MIAGFRCFNRPMRRLLQFSKNSLIKNIKALSRLILIEIILKIMLVIIGSD